MKIKTIEASGSNEHQNPETLLKRWRGLRFTAEIREDENEMECTKELQKKLENALDPFSDATLSQTFDKHFTNLNVSQPIPSIDYRAKEKLEIDIDNARSQEELVAHWADVVKYGMEKQYEEKYRTLPITRTD